MSDAPNAETEQGALSPKASAAYHHCEKLYARWLHARAVYFDPEQDMSDDAMGERSDRERAAGWRLLATPCALPWMIWRKWEVLDLWAAEERLSGPAADNRLMFALGCIKAELIRFGIGGPAE